MSTKEPAFPVAFGCEAYHPGMTLRQYAAIKLKVPNSGTDWLDAMIVESQRDKFAEKAMQGLLASDVQAKLNDFAKYSYEIADAMLEARK